MTHEASQGPAVTGVLFWLSGQVMPFWLQFVPVAVSRI
jgi:hypothetical protein